MKTVITIETKDLTSEVQTALANLNFALAPGCVGGAEETPAVENGANGAEPVTFTREQIGQALREFGQAHGDRDKAIELLNSFGAKTLGELDESKYVEIHAAASVLPDALGA